MPYLDSAGNVADPTVQNWVYFHRVQQVVAKLFASAPPATNLPAGAEKASKGTH